MSVADKLITIANNTPLVCEKLYTEKTVSGNTIVVGDVSPIEHSLDVKVKSRNLIVPEAIKQLYTKTTNFDIYSKTKPLLLSSGTYTFCYLGKDIVHQLDIWNVDTSEKIIMLYNKATYTFTLIEDTNIYICLYSANGFTEYTKEFYQLELGSFASTYTPYITDFGGVSVSRYGKNLINPDVIKHIYGTATKGVDIYSTTNPLLLSSGTYTFSYLGIDMVHELSIFNADTSEKIAVVYNKSTYTFTLTEYTNVYFSIYNRDGFTEYTKEFYQLEVGLTATEYVSYKESQTVTANFDGTVEGLTSVSPNMTLLTNSNDVILNCTYHSGNNPTANEKFIELQEAFTTAKKAIKD